MRLISGTKWRFYPILVKNYDERALITTTLISSCHGKTFVSFCFAKEKTWERISTWITAKSYRKTDHAIQNNNKWTIWWYMMLFIHCFFWLKNWWFSINICKGLLYPYRRYKIITRNYFCVCHNNRQKHNQYFKTNLHLITSNQVNSHRKLNLPDTNSISLVFAPLEMQGKIKIVYHTFFLLCLKRNDPQTFKSSSSKNNFLH